MLCLLFIYRIHLFIFQINMTHLIKHLSFGKDYPGIVNPLDDTNVSAPQGQSISTIDDFVPLKFNNHNFIYRSHSFWFHIKKNQAGLLPAVQNHIIASFTYTWNQQYWFFWLGLLMCCRAIGHGQTCFSVFVTIIKQPEREKKRQKVKQLKGNQGEERWQRFSFVIVFKCPPPSGLRHCSVISTLRDKGYMSALLTKLICWVKVWRHRVHAALWPKPLEKSHNRGGGPPSAADAHPDGHEGAKRAAALHHGLADSSHQLPAAHPDPFRTEAETARYFTMIAIQP